MADHERKEQQKSLASRGGINSGDRVGWSWCRRCICQRKRTHYIGDI